MFLNIPEKKEKQKISKLQVQKDSQVKIKENIMKTKKYVKLNLKISIIFHIVLGRQGTRKSIDIETTRTTTKTTRQINSK